MLYESDGVLTCFKNYLQVCRIKLDYSCLVFKNIKGCCTVNIVKRHRTNYHTKVYTLGGLHPHPGSGKPSGPMGQGASNPGTP